jgi:hypothetical protein
MAPRQQGNAGSNQADENDARVEPGAGGIAGGDAAQAEPTSSKSAKEIRSELAFAPDREHHPGSAGDLDREADRTSAPTALDAEPHDPPVRTAGPDVGIRTLGVGAGEHDPPDREVFDAEGRARIVGADGDGNPQYATSGMSGKQAERKAEKGS